MPADSNYTGYKAFYPAAAASAYLRVNVNSSGKVAVQDNTARGIGVLWADTDAASLLDVNVRLNTAPGTTLGIFSGTTTTVGDLLYAASAGTVATTGTVVVGVNMNLLSIQLYAVGQPGNAIVEYMVQSAL